MTTEFKTTASTSMHGPFPVAIFIEHTDNWVPYQTARVIAVISGKEWEMEYNASTCPDDRIQAGAKFAQAVGAKYQQSIRCDCSEVVAFIKGIRAAWREQDAREDREIYISRRNQEL